MGFFLQKWESDRIPSEFCKRLKELRSHLDLKIEVLGALIGVGKSSVSRWENGDTLPDYREIMMLIKATKCNGVWLLFGQESMFTEESLNQSQSSSEELRYTIDLQKRIIANLEAELSVNKSVELVS